MPATRERSVQEIIERYEKDPGMLIPMMQDLQAEHGYLPPEELKTMARELGVPVTRVYGIAMFYASFRLSPRGQHDVTLCMGTVCYLKGAPKIREAIREEYGIEPGGTTEDRLFTLQAVNCVGACALAPVMVVDGKYHDGVTPESALKILKALGSASEAEGGEEPAPAAKAPEPESAPPVTAVPAPAPAAPAPVQQAASAPKGSAAAKTAAKKAPAPKKASAAKKRPAPRKPSAKKRSRP